jgi:hypothetical protein
VHARSVAALWVDEDLQAAVHRALTAAAAPA